MTSAFKYAEALEKTGVPPDQARVHAMAWTEIVEERVATKQDLRELELRLEAKLADTRAELIKWVVGVSLASTGLLLGLLKFAP